jgi:hypothetical protein
VWLLHPLERICSGGEFLWRGDSRALGVKRPGRRAVRDESRSGVESEGDGHPGGNAGEDGEG